MTVIMNVGYNNVFSQSIALKSNAITLVSGIPNIGVEYTIFNKSTIEFSYYHKYFELERIGRLRFYMTQLELKNWFCREFVGAYWGSHIFFSEYNVGGINAFNLRDYRYQGLAYGGGVSLGYNFLLSKRWNIELCLGFGYLKFQYEKFDCEHCGDLIKKDDIDCIGPTKAGVNLVYLIK